VGGLTPKPLRKWSTRPGDLVETLVCRRTAKKISAPRPPFSRYLGSKFYILTSFGTNRKWKRLLPQTVGGGCRALQSLKISRNCDVAFRSYSRKTFDIFCPASPAKIRFWKALQPKPEVEFGRKRGNGLSTPGFLFEFVFIIGPISYRFGSTPRDFYHYGIVKAMGLSRFFAVQMAVYWTGSQLWPFLEGAFRNPIPWYLAV